MMHIKIGNGNEIKTESNGYGDKNLHTSIGAKTIAVFPASTRTVFCTSKSKHEGNTANPALKQNQKLLNLVLITSMQQ